MSINNPSKVVGTSALPLAEKYLSPAQITQRWPFHVESIRRKIRRGEIASVVIGRRRLVPMSEIQRVEAEGRVPAKGLPPIGCD